MTSKLLRSIGIGALASVMLFGRPAAAGAQNAQTPESVAGTWAMSLIGDHVIPVALVLEQNGAAVKGTFTLMGRDFPLTGDFVGGKLTLSGKGPFGRGQANPHDGAAAADGSSKPKTATVEIKGPQTPSPNMATSDMTITGTADADGMFAGNIAIKVGEGTGLMKWTAERFKERKVPASQAVSTEGVNLTGNWKLAINEAQITLDVELTQSGTDVTGTAKNDHLGAMLLKGTLANGTLSFVTTGSAGGQDIRIEYSGKYKADGTFTGDLSSQMGAMTWTAERVKK